ncbi:MAG: hypothetical protein AB8I08_16975 [Sandaracinaceae bacterium]
MVLLIGILIGAVGMRAYDLRTAARWLRSPAADKRAQLLEELLDRQLDLDPQQRRQMSEVIEDQRPEFDAMMAEVRPSRVRLRTQLVEESSSFLRPDQLRRLRTLMAEANARDEVQARP